MKKLFTTLLFISLFFMCFSQTYTVYDANTIKAQLHCRNYQFTPPNATTPGYEFPAGAGTSTLYTTNLWVYGEDMNTNTIKGFGDIYGVGNDTWPGPLTISGTATTTTPVSNQYDTVWKITQDEIIDFVNAFNNGSVTNLTYPVPNSILNWPAQGPAGYSQSLSPFHDENSDGTYNPYDGDYPLIQGTQMLRWIMNDNLGLHTAMGAPGMGIEIQASFFGCSSPDSSDPVNRTTFLEYKIVNRSTSTYENVYIGLNIDGDIGGALDDYIRANITNNSVQFYNGDSYDATHLGVQGYLDTPPVQSITLVDVDGYSIPNLMSGMMYYNNGVGPTGDPGGYMDQYNYMQSTWKDGTHLSYGGAGYAASGQSNCRYMFPGDSDPTDYGTYGVPQSFEWSEENADSLGAVNTPGDRRAILSSGPLLFLPGKTMTVVYAFITTQDSTLSTDSLISKNNAEIMYITQKYLAQQLPCQYEHIGLETQDAPKIGVFPNPTNDQAFIQSDLEITQVEILNMNGSCIKVSVNTNTLNTQDLLPGIYILRVYHKNHLQPTIKKLVISR